MAKVVHQNVEQLVVHGALILVCEMGKHSTLRSSHWLRRARNNGLGGTLENVMTTCRLLTVLIGFSSLAGCAAHAADPHVTKAEAAIRAALKDPDSAQFRNVRYVAATKTVCGEYNAKNGFGGYVGYRAFAIDEDGNRTDPPDATYTGAYRDAALETMQKLCVP